MSETEFTEDERAEAYAFAKEKIAEVKADGATRLDLDPNVNAGRTRTLTSIPPEIAELTKLTNLDLQSTQV